ncbi:GNAT family N-acetyltransferase [Pelosinus sp. sgz500959]|uniref:GNAT family N-acetyltransferase n=1 Tax=Pelosinus sp. sgz500959 TaxID=3242472 RepID=UPI003671AFA6
MQKQDLVIRAIREADIDAVQNFLLGQLQELFAQEGQLAITNDIWGIRKTYLEPINCNMWGVFTRLGEVVGTAAICTYNDRIELLKGRYDLPITAEVGRFYIDKSLRRQGLGSNLVKTLTDFCIKQGYLIMYLHTHRFLPGGFNFWEKQGFVITIDEGGSAEIVHMEKILT